MIEKKKDIEHTIKSLKARIKGEQNWRSVRHALEALYRCAYTQGWEDLKKDLEDSLHNIGVL
jgi:hypothetical protein